MDNRVWVGECGGPPEAVVVRSLFMAYGIPVLISGENNGRLFPSMLGVFGSSTGAYQIKVFVSRAHAEDAAALLAEMHGSEHVSAGDDDLDGTSIRGPRDVTTGLISGPRTLLGDCIHRWSNTALALLLATMLGFGAAHLYYLRPWWRGAALAIVQLAVLAFFAGSLHRFAVLIGIARIADILGVLRQIWSDTTAEELNARSGAPA